ncbi:MAG TPA: hypothetical protein VKX28_29430 [Xanthobacteraceae bacterium]|nr:hypothetical protein [Xanthobacteraceae bacterium]
MHIGLLVGIILAIALGMDRALAAVDAERTAEKLAMASAGRAHYPFAGIRQSMRIAASPLVLRLRRREITNIPSICAALAAASMWGP